MDCDHILFELLKTFLINVPILCSITNMLAFELVVKRNDIGQSTTTIKSK